MNMKALISDVLNFLYGAVELPDTNQSTILVCSFFQPIPASCPMWYYTSVASMHVMGASERFYLQYNSHEFCSDND